MSAIETIGTGFAGRYPGGYRAGSFFGALLQRFLKHGELRRTRLHLSELSDDQLRDIGITRDAADREAARSIIVQYLYSAR